MAKEEYLLLSRKEKNDYFERYSAGYKNKNTLILLNNIISIVSPTVDFKNWFWEIEKNKDHTFIDIVFYNRVKNVMGSFKNKLISSHVDYIRNNALLGDIYINFYSGKIYQIKNLTNEGIVVAYLGTMVGPAPDVDITSISPFIKNSNEKYENNKIKLNTNILNGIGTGKDYKERYTFSIPELPNFTVSSNLVSNTNNPTVESVIDNETDFRFNFNLPKSAKFYTGSSAPISNNNIYSNGDIFVITGYSENRGNLYIYQNDLWVHKGSILGPAGMPKILGKFNFVMTDDENKQYNQIPNKKNSFYTSKLAIKEEDSDITIENSISSREKLLHALIAHNDNFTDILINIIDNNHNEDCVFIVECETEDVDDAGNISINYKETWWVTYFIDTSKKIILGKYDSENGIFKEINTISNSFIVPDSKKIILTGDDVIEGQGILIISNDIIDIEIKKDEFGQGYVDLNELELENDIIPQTVIISYSIYVNVADVMLQDVNILYQDGANYYQWDGNQYYESELITSFDELFSISIVSGGSGNDSGMNGNITTSYDSNPNIGVVYNAQFINDRIVWDTSYFKSSGGN